MLCCVVHLFSNCWSQWSTEISSVNTCPATPHQDQRRATRTPSFPSMPSFSSFFFILFLFFPQNAPCQPFEPVSVLGVHLCFLHSFLSIPPNKFLCPRLSNPHAGPGHRASILHLLYPNLGPLRRLLNTCFMQMFSCHHPPLPHHTSTPPTATGKTLKSTASTIISSLTVNFNDSGIFLSVQSLMHYMNELLLKLNYLDLNSH